MSDWKDAINLDESTEKVEAYLSENLKETWKQETENQGFSSLSKYIVAKVEQSRAEQQVQRTATTSEDADELKNRIQDLEKQLEKEKRKTGQNTDLGSPETVKQVLGYQHKTLEEVIREIIESGQADQLIRKPVETQLYHMAESEESEYQRGRGWKLASNGGGN